MSGRRIAVDLGPLSLSLLDGGASYVSGQQVAARSDDVLRLRSLMRQGAGAHAAHVSPGADSAAAKSPTGSDSAPTGMTSGPAAMPATAMATLDEAQVEWLAFELSAALMAAPLLHTQKSADIRLALRPTVLRDAELGVVDRDGTLEFSLWVGNDDDCQWLAAQLPRLARTLGERLRRRLRMQLFERMRQQLMAEQAWPPEAAE